MQYEYCVWLRFCCCCTGYIGCWFFAYSNLAHSKVRLQTHFEAWRSVLCLTVFVHCYKKCACQNLKYNEGVEWKLYIVDISMKYDLHSTPSTKIHWNFNFRKLFSISVSSVLNTMCRWISLLIFVTQHNTVQVHSQVLYYTSPVDLANPKCWYYTYWTVDILTLQLTIKCTANPLLAAKIHISIWKGHNDPKIPNLFGFLCVWVKVELPMFPK